MEMMKVERSVVLKVDQWDDRSAVWWEPQKGDKLVAWMDHK
jgi:hypothetical protein